MNQTIWAVFSEWDEINSEVNVFYEQWIVCEKWEAFMSCNCVKERKGCLRSDEYGLKGMSSELKES